MEEHFEQTISWNVVYDARGHFTEPHTQVEVALGTLEVRQYLGERPGFGPAIKLNSSTFFLTRGPENRYSTVLFIEKEGFDPLLQAARIAERFDIAIMSTKGMSVTASRLLLDRLSVRGVTKVLVLHDFDRTAFSIFGTLGTDGRRYSVFVSYWERKLEEHGVREFLPKKFTIEKHARRIFEQIGTEKALKAVLEEIQEEAQTVPLPKDLLKRVRRVLRDSPATSWDAAVSKVIRKWYSRRD